MQDGRANARPASVTAGELDTGARIGRYVIIERVGSGAMGVVYGAYDPELDRKVALKLLKPRAGRDGHGAGAPAARGEGDGAAAAPQRRRRARRRRRSSDQVFLAMEFVERRHARELARRANRAAGARSSRCSSPPGRGLAAAHAAGLVHRDFKPDNVLLDKERRPRVVDFGLARQAGAGDDELAGETGDVTSQDGDGRRCAISSGKHALATLTKTGTWVGTPAYMAPEQFLGERGDARSDQFSFCVALYEALYGERPFAGDDLLASRSTSRRSSCARCPRITTCRPGCGA